MSWVVSEVHRDCVTSFMTASLKCFPCSIPHIQLQPDGRRLYWRTHNNPFIGADTREKQKTLQWRKNTDQKLKAQILHGSGFYCGCLKTWTWRLFTWKYPHASLSFTHTLQHSTPPALPSIIQTRVLVCLDWAPLIQMLSVPLISLEATLTPYHSLRQYGVLQEKPPCVH